MIDSSESFLCRNCRTPLAGIISVPPSPIPHLLGTNKVPSDAEAHKIRVSIATVRSGISQLDVDIARAQHVLDQLRTEREALKAYVDDHAMVISPVRQVPAEIWSQVFLHCLPRIVELPWSTDDIIFSKREVFNPRNAPTLLLRVCRDWTTTALSSPRLWARIGLFSRPCFQPTAATIRTWLRRSHQVPLTVVFQPNQLAVDGMNSFFQNPAIPSVLEQSHRWRVVNIRFPLFLLSMFSPLKNHLPELEELHLRFYSVYPPDTPVHTSVDIFHNAPKLRRVTLYDPPPIHISNIKLPWTQLTKFSSHHPQGMALLWNVLNLASNLVEVDWRLGPYDSQNQAWRVDAPPPMVQHLSLRDFSIHVDEPALSGIFLDRITLSSLRTLSINASAQCWSMPQLASFISQNRCSLDSFELDSSDISGSQLIACMENLQSISHLTLSICISVALPTTQSKLNTAQKAVGTLLRALSYTSGRKDLVLLPKLKTIAIQCRIPVSCEVGGEFVDMVESRWRVPALSHGRDMSCQSNVTASRLDAASLKLECSPEFNMNPVDLGRLQTLRDEGLPVQVSLSYKRSLLFHVIPTS